MRGNTTSLFAILAGFRFGFVTGVVVTHTGFVLSCALVFAVGRYTGVESSRINAFAESGRKIADQLGDLRSVVSAMLFPLLPPDPVSYAAGLTGISFPVFVTGTAIGGFLWTVLYVSAGASMTALSFDSVSLDPGVVLLTGLAAVVTLARPVYETVDSWQAKSGR